MDHGQRQRPWSWIEAQVDRVALLPLPPSNDSFAGATDLGSVTNGSYPGTMTGASAETDTRTGPGVQRVHGSFFDWETYYSHGGLRDWIPGPHRLVRVDRAVRRRVGVYRKLVRTAHRDLCLHRQRTR